MCLAPLFTERYRPSVRTLTSLSLRLSLHLSFLVWTALYAFTVFIFYNVVFLYMVYFIHFSLYKLFCELTWWGQNKFLRLTVMQLRSGVCIYAEKMIQNLNMHYECRECKGNTSSYVPSEPKEYLCCSVIIYE